MRVLCPAGALIAAVAALLPFPAVSQSAIAGLSVVNYQFVNEQRATRTQWYVTYRADLMNTGAALPGVTAMVRSKVATVTVVSGQNILHFAPVLAGGITPGTQTFTLLVDRSAVFDFSSAIEWSFNYPVANAGSPQTVAVGSTATLNGAGSTNPSGVGTLSYAWSFVSRASGSAAVLHDANSARPSFVVDAPGDYVLELVVNNGVGSDSARTTVSTRNSAPTANAGQSQTTSVGATVALDGSKSSDVDGDPLTYFWTLIDEPAGSTAFIANARSVLASITIDKPGSYLIQLVVNDGKIDSAPSLIRITTANTGPVANAGPDQSVDVGSFVQLNGAGSTDVDGDPLTFKWTFVSVPDKSAAKLSAPDAVNPSFTADVPGTYTVQLIVNDGKVDSAPDVVNIRTNALQPPTADAGPNQTVVHGAQVSLNGKGTDPQSLPLVYVWSLLTRPPGSQSKLSATNIPNPTFTTDVPGTYVAQLIVTSPYLNSAPSTVTITTTNTPPVANAGSDTAGIVGAAVQLNGSLSSDADHDPLTYSWSLTTVPASSKATLSSPTSAKPTFVPDVAGTYVAQLIVNDGYSNSAPATVSITIDGYKISLTPNPLELTTVPGTLTINVSIPSPSGLEVSLTGFDPSVISVPSTVAVQPNSTGANVRITPLKTGSTNILASAPGYQPGSVAVHVTSPGIVVTLSAPGVGVGRSLDGTVTISSPAPAAGTVVTLSAAPAGLVSLSAIRLVIGSGQTSAPFTLTGVAKGSATITATADLFDTGTATVLVADLGAISLGPDKTVAAGQSVPLALTLSSAAPVGGVHIDLTSSDKSKAQVPASVFIEQGATAPKVQPEVSGIDFGNSTITASSLGYTSATITATVVGKLSFQPPNVTFIAGETEHDVVVALSAPAPSGLSVKLASSNSGIVTLPDSVQIPANASSAHVVLKAVTAGTATVTASSTNPNVSSGTANVTVPSAGAISLGPVALALGNSADLQITLSTAPTTAVTVALSSSDDSKVGISVASVSIPAGSTHPAVAPKLTGNGPGTATIRATAPGWTTGTQDVAVSATMSFSPSSLSLSGAETQNLTLTLSGPAPTGGLAVALSSSSTSVATVGASVTIAAGAKTATVPVTAVGPGSAVIKASAASVPDALANVSVTQRTDILVPDKLTVAPGATVPFVITLARPASSTVVIDLTSSDTTKATLSQSQVVVNAGQTEPTRGVNITGVAFGTTMVTAKAAGMTTAMSQVTVGLTATLSPSDLVVPIASDGTLTITLSSPAPSAMTFTISSSDPAVVSVPGSVPMSAGTSSVGFKVTPLKSGSAVIKVTAPNVADMTSNVTVGTPGTITLSASSLAMQLWSSVDVTITLSKPAPGSGTTVTLTTDPTRLKLSQSVVTIPSGSSTATVKATGINVGSPAVSATAPGYNPSTPITLKVGATIEWVTPTLTIPGTGQQAWLELRLNATVPGSTAFSPTDGITVNLSSSRPDVATVPPTATFYWDGSTAPVLRIPVTSVGAGTAQIHAAGINIPDVVATVIVNGPLSIVTTALPGGNVGVAYSVTLEASGGAPPYHWAQTGLPAELTLDPLSGRISGTPLKATSGTAVVVSVSDSATPAATVRSSFTLTIAQVATSLTALSGSGQTTIVNTRFGAPLVAVLKDAGGYPVVGADVTFTAPASGPGATFAGSATVKTDASGMATSPVLTANTTAGAFSVSAAFDKLSANFSLTNSPDPTAASVAVQSGDGQSAEVGKAFAKPLVAVVKDKYGNPLKGITVTFTAPASGPSGTFAAGLNTAVTDSAGVATSAVFSANTLVGTYSVLASVGALSAKFGMTNVVGSPASVTVVAGSSQSAPINTAFQSPLQVLVKDKFGNPVPDSTVTFGVPASGASAVFAGGVATAKTNAAGIATSAAVSANSIAGGYNVTATAASTLVPAPSATLSLTNLIGPVATVEVIAGSPQSATVGTAFAARFQVRVKDAGQNLVTNSDVVFVVVPVGDVGGSFPGGASQATVKTDSSGVATAPVFTANTKPGSYTVTATAGTKSATISLTNIITPVGSITIVSGSLQTATVATAFANPLKAVVKDNLGNPIPGATVTFTAPAASTVPGAAFAGGVNTAVTDASGIATSAVLTANTKAGQFSVTAVIDKFTASFSLTNTAEKVAAKLAVVSGSSQQATVNTPFAAPLKASVADRFDNPIKDAVVTFTPPTTGASATFAGGLSTATTDAGGIATSAILTANKKAGGPYSIKAASGSLSVDFTQFTNIVDKVASIAVSSGSSQTAIVGAPFSPLKALVTDQWGNPIQGATVTFAGPASGPGVTFATNPATGVSDANGIATSPALSANGTSGGPYDVSATVAGFVAKFSLTNLFDRSSATISVSAGSNQAAVVNTAFATALKVVVKDARGNAVPDMTVTFAAPTTGPSGTFTTANPVKTDASGFASVGFKANTVAGGPYSVTATIPGSTPPPTVTFTLTNKPDPTAASITVVSGSGQLALPNAAFANPLKAVVKDQYGNTIPQAAVTFKAPSSGPSATFTGGVLTAVVNTDNTGIATSPALTANSQGGTYNVAATVAALTANFSLTNKASVAKLSVVSGSDQIAVVKTAFALPLKVLAQDAANNPVPNVTVTFTPPATGPSGTFASVATAVTDGSGVATSTAFTANDKAGTYSVEARVGNVAVSFNLTNNHDVPTVSAQLPVTQGTPIKTAFPNPLTALVADKYNNPVSGVDVTFTAPSGSGIASADFGSGAITTKATSNNAGLASVAVGANSVVGSYDVVASIAIGNTTSFHLTNQQGQVCCVNVVSGSPQVAQLLTWYALPLTAVVTDSGGNPLRGVAVTFTAPVPVPGTPAATAAFATSDPNVTVSSVKVLTDSLGVAVTPALLANNVRGSFLVVATLPDYPKVPPANFTLTNGTPIIIGVSNATIGGNLQGAITITFAPQVPPGGANLVLTSADETKALIGNASSAGKKTITVPVSEGTTSVTTTVQALVSSGTTTITASSTTPGFIPGTGTMTFAPSGFVLISPKGLGAAFDAYQGTTTTLTVQAGRLDGSGGFAQAQEVRGGTSVSVPVGLSLATLGSLSTTAVAISGGSGQGTVDFKATTASTGATDVIISPPDASFSQPSSGTTATANVLKATCIPFNTTVGQGLQKAASIGLNGVAPADTIVTLHSADPKVKFSLDPTVAGSQTLNVTIPMNFSGTPDFYVQAFGNSGAIGYTATASICGTVSGTVTLAPTGLMIESPAGKGAPSFTAPLSAGSAMLTVYVGRLDSAGNFAEIQMAAGNTQVPIALSSSNTSVADLTLKNINIGGAANSATTFLNLVAKGTTTVTATSGTLKSAQVAATVTDARSLFVDSDSSNPVVVGNKLVQVTYVHLAGGPAGPGGVDVLVQSNNAAFKVGGALDDPGSTSTTVNVPEGSNIAPFWIIGAASSGTGTYTVSAPAYISATGYVQLAPSGIIIFPPTVTVPLSQGTTALTLYVGTLSSTGVLTATQAVAGGVALDVAVSSNNTAVATVPLKVTVPKGADNVTFSATLKAKGSATISLGTPPAGFSNPASAYTKTAVTVN